jgi:large subunit ribosomal protein L24
MKAHVKKDDVVVVISGSQRGKSGKVLAVDNANQRVLVEGVNVGRKTMKRRAGGAQGGIIERERPLHVSNVMLEANYQARQAKRGAPAASPAAAAKSE